MELLFYSFNIADIPVSVIILLLLSACSAAIPGSRLLLDIFALVLVAAAVSIALLAGADMLLLAACLFLVLTVYTAFLNKRRKDK